MNKLLKTLGIGTALVGCGIAIAGFQCDRCHRRHNGNRCPAVTLGVACDGRYYCEEEDGWDSDDEFNYYLQRYSCEMYEDELEDIYRVRKAHHKKSINRIVEAIKRVKIPAELCRIREAVDNRARDAHIGYGVEDGYPYYDDVDYITYQHNRRYHFNCHDQFNCYDPYGCNSYGY